MTATLDDQHRSSRWPPGLVKVFRRSPNPPSGTSSQRPGRSSTTARSETSCPSLRTPRQGEITRRRCRLISDRTVGAPKRASNDPSRLTQRTVTAVGSPAGGPTHRRPSVVGPRGVNGSRVAVVGPVGRASGHSGLATTGRGVGHTIGVRPAWMTAFHHTCGYRVELPGRRPVGRCRWCASRLAARGLADTTASGRPWLVLALRQGGLAAALRTWSRDGQLLAIGFLDGPEVFRMTVAPRSGARTSWPTG